VFASQDVGIKPGGEVWILGDVSVRAVRVLKSRGWTVRAKVQEDIGINDVGILAKADADSGD
jgi:hypothetical protein